MFLRRVNVRGIVYRDGELLSVRHKNKDDIASKYWAVPGGGLDDGEDLLSGLHREMIEETGIEPVIGKLLLIQQFNDGKKEHMEFFFHIENARDYESIDLTKTSHGLAELAECRFADPRTIDILPELLKDFDYHSAISGDIPVTYYDGLSEPVLH